MKKTIYYLNKEGRRIIGKEKFITYEDESIPESLVDHVETQDIKTTFQVGDIVEMENRFTSETIYDTISEIDLRKGTIKLEECRLKFNIEDGSCKRSGYHEKIKKVTNPETIEKIKNQIERKNLADEISWKLDEQNLLYEMDIEELTEIKKIIDKYDKDEDNKK